MTTPALILTILAAYLAIAFLLTFERKDVSHTRFCRLLTIATWGLWSAEHEPTHVSGEKRCPRCGRYIHYVGSDEHSRLYEVGRKPVNTPSSPNETPPI